MCIIWVRKYILCGCIWDVESAICPTISSCWGRRMIQLQDKMRTCKECWGSGDKRIGSDEVDGIEYADKKKQGKKKESQNGIEDHYSNVFSFNLIGGENGAKRDFKHQEEEEGEEEEEQFFSSASSISSSPPSRPETPPIEFKSASDSESDPGFEFDAIPEYLLADEFNYDLSRVCDPVDRASVYRNYRSRRGRTDWYRLEDLCGRYFGPNAENPDIFINSQDGAQDPRKDQKCFSGVQ